VHCRTAEVALVGRSVTPTLPGRAGVAAVRPEDVELTTDASGPNILRGRVRLIEYLGREYDVEVVLESEQRVKARVQSPPAPGAVVGLRLPPDRVIVLPEEPR
jgi:ABC-type Fe3+/spermidine/putrescine transport system ATPase subunit